MALKINTDKKRFSKAEAKHLLDRPWKTTPELRRALRKMLEPKQETQAQEEPPPPEDEDPDNEENDENEE